MRLRFVQLCDHTALDHAANPCLIGMFDQLNLPALPGGITRLHLMVSIAMEPEDAHAQPIIRCVLLDPDGQIEFGVEAELFTGDTLDRPVAYLRFPEVDIPLTQFGTHRWEVQLEDGTLLGHDLLNVRQSEQLAFGTASM